MVQVKDKLFPWGSLRRYHDYATFLKGKFDGKVQKISINAGFTCPNRDGLKDFRGCAYCNNITFRPEYCEPGKSVSQQIEEGIRFFSWKYPEMRYLAYFQSYSNTYGELDLLDKVYSEALAHPKVVGLAIATRPDCVNDDVLDLIGEKAKKHFVTIEYGIESTLDRTLDRINRHHLFEDTTRAVRNTKMRHIHTGGHLILGLPGESREDMLSHALRISDLPLDTLKLHQLQIVKNTTFATEYKRHPEEFHLFEQEEYIELIVEFLELLHPRISVERFVNQSPADMLIAPKWGIRNFEILAKIDQRMKQIDTWQGKCYPFAMHI